jgi:hypothetical protein
VTSNDDYVLQLLQENGLVTQKQVDAAAVSLRQEGETTVDVLLNMGLITEAVTLNLIAAGPPRPRDAQRDDPRHHADRDSPQIRRRAAV